MDQCIYTIFISGIKKYQFSCKEMRSLTFQSPIFLVFLIIVLFNIKESYISVSIRIDTQLDLEAKETLTIRYSYQATQSSWKILKLHTHMKSIMGIINTVQHVTTNGIYI